MRAAGQLGHGHLTSPTPGGPFTRVDAEARLEVCRPLAAEPRLQLPACEERAALPAHIHVLHAQELLERRRPQVQQPAVTLQRRHEKLAFEEQQTPGTLGATARHEVPGPEPLAIEARETAVGADPEPPALIPLQGGRQQRVGFGVVTEIASALLRVEAADAMSRAAEPAVLGVDRLDRPDDPAAPLFRRQPALPASIEEAMQAVRAACPKGAIGREVDLRDLSLLKAQGPPNRHEAVPLPAIETVLEAGIGLRRARSRREAADEDPPLGVASQSAGFSQTEPRPLSLHVAPWPPARAVVDRTLGVRTRRDGPDPAQLVLCEPRDTPHPDELGRAEAREQVPVGTPSLDAAAQAHPDISGRAADRGQTGVALRVGPGIGVHVPPTLPARREIHTKQQLAFAGQPEIGGAIAEQVTQLLGLGIGTTQLTPRCTVPERQLSALARPHIDAPQIEDRLAIGRTCFRRARFEQRLAAEGPGPALLVAVQDQCQARTLRVFGHRDDVAFAEIPPSVLDQDARALVVADEEPRPRAHEARPARDRLVEGPGQRSQSLRRPLVEGVCLHSRHAIWP
jgi:hypothetical protein